MSRRRRHAESLASRLCQFFADNPDEELTYEDIAVKFGAKPDSISTTIGRLRSSGKVDAAFVVRGPRITVQRPEVEPCA